MSATRLILASLLCASVAHADEGDANCPFDQDRAAILAMAGEYQVNFHFEETVPLMVGYELKKPYDEHALELVEVVENSPKRIVLQHLLIVHPEGAGEDVQPRVIKHWRQDWTYEDANILTYRGHDTWERVEYSPDEVKGTWSQAVYQTDDGPRYEAFGKWIHEADRSSWQSQQTWRPLPRREYTKRDDYHALGCINRHTITHNGWIHEQDNYKLVLNEAGEPTQTIAHEQGLNTYTRTENDDFDFARAYWESTEPFWQDVRTAWDDVFTGGDRMTVTTQTKAGRLASRMTMLARRARKADPYDTATFSGEIKQTLSEYVTY